MLHNAALPYYSAPCRSNKPYFTICKKNTDKYTGTLFVQNWHLFAPDPLTVNLKLYVRAKYDDPTIKKEVETEWHDITRHMIAVNDRSLFSPYNRMLRIAMGYINQLHIGGMDDLTYRIVQKKQKTIGDLSDYAQFAESTIETQEKALYRYSSSVLKKLYPNIQLKEVQYMTSSTEAIPFSKRNDVNYKSEEKLTISEWREITKDVVAFP